MRFNLTATFENAEDESVISERGVPLTSKILAIRVLNNGMSCGVPPAQGGCDQADRERRGRLSRRFKKANGHINLSPEELVLLKKCSADAAITPHLHDQFCELIDGSGAETKSPDAPEQKAIAAE